MWGYIAVGVIDCDQKCPTAFKAKDVTAYQMQKPIPVVHSMSLVVTALIKTIYMNIQVDLNTPHCFYLTFKEMHLYENLNTTWRNLKPFLTEVTD